MSGPLDIIDIVSDYAFKSLVWDIFFKNLAVKFVMFFGMTPNGAAAIALTKIVLYFTEKAYVVFKKTVKVGTIVLANDVHQKSYERASLKLKIIAREKGIESDEFKNQRKIEHDKQADLVIFNIQYK